jgi:hypothetical protein
MSTILSYPNGRATLFCGGITHLHRSSGVVTTTLMIEVDLDLETRTIQAIYVNPELKELNDALESELVGQPMDAIAPIGARIVDARCHTSYRKFFGRALSMSSAFLELLNHLPSESTIHSQAS